MTFVYTALYVKSCFISKGDPLVLYVLIIWLKYNLFLMDLWPYDLVKISRTHTLLTKGQFGFRHPEKHWATIVIGVSAVTSLCLPCPNTISSWGITKQILHSVVTFLLPLCWIIGQNARMQGQCGNKRYKLEKCKWIMVYTLSLKDTSHITLLVHMITSSVLFYYTSFSFMIFKP